MSWLVRSVLVVLVLGSGMASCAWGQAGDSRGDPIADPEWLRAYLERERQAHRLPAIAAAVVVNGKVVAASAVGVRKAGTSARVTRNDPFHLGALAEPMSATMFGALVDQGLLRWDMTMAEMFPELARAMQPEYRGVTVAQLLGHASGFPDQPGTSEPIIDARASTITGRRYEYVKAAVEDRPAAPPGTKGIGSGGAVVVASAAERLTRQSYEGLMQRLLFKPLGMTHTGFGNMSAQGRIDGPWSHVVKADAITPIPPDRSHAVQTLAPTGRNAHGSIIDLARFVALWIHGAQGRSRYLRPETFHRLQTAVPPGNFAPGWVLIAHPEWSQGKGLVLARNGSNDRNSAVCRVAPAEGYAVCVMANLGGDEANRACESVLDWLIVRVIRQRLTDDGSLASRPIPPQPDIPLERLTPEKATTGLGEVRIDRTAANTPLVLDGVTYVHGIGVHANAELIYALKPEYRRFVARVGIDDRQTWHGTVVVKVYAGDKLLSESGVIRGGDSPWRIDVPLPDRVAGRPPRQLRLVVDGTPDGNDGDLTDWIHAGFLKGRRGG